MNSCRLSKKVYIVTRHDAAAEWILDNMEKQFRFEGSMPYAAMRLRHFAMDDIGCITRGDIVVGVLPLHIAACVCTRGARFVSLQMTVPPNLRGVDITYEQMVEECLPRLTEYKIEEIG